MIRTANLADEVAIAKCVSSAFDNFGEVTLIQQLGADGDKLIELVFEESGTVSGYVLISNLRLQDAPQLRCGAIAPIAYTLITNFVGLVQSLRERPFSLAGVWGWMCFACWGILVSIGILAFASRIFAATTILSTFNI